MTRSGSRTSWLTSRSFRLELLLLSDDELRLDEETVDAELSVLDELLIELIELIELLELLELLLELGLDSDDRLWLERLDELALDSSETLDRLESVLTLLSVLLDELSLETLEAVDPLLRLLSELGDTLEFVDRLLADDWLCVLGLDALDWLDWLDGLETLDGLWVLRLDGLDGLDWLDWLDGLETLDGLWVLAELPVERLDEEEKTSLRLLDDELLLLDDELVTLSGWLAAGENHAPRALHHAAPNQLMCFDCAGGRGCHNPQLAAGHLWYRRQPPPLY